MSSIPGVGNSSAAASSAKSVKGNDLNDVDIDEFLNLLITELQNQDPLNPTDNSDMLNQIGQIREIGSNDKLTSTLTDLAAGQELSNASTMIGKRVTALDNTAANVEGVVERVSVQTDPEDPSIRKVSVHIGDAVVDISNIREILEN